MASLRFLPALLCVTACCRLASGQEVEQTSEERLIAVLQSDASAQAKDDACVRLKLIATERSIPAVAALLSDPQLSHSARYVLESMTGPQAGIALIDALAKTEGIPRRGIINSLGVRRQAEAVPSLAKLLATDELGTAVAAATALGHIGGTDALVALEEAYDEADGPIRGAMEDGILECARRLLDAGAYRDAYAVSERLYRATTADHVRTAAFRWMILASEEDALSLVVSAIRVGKNTDRLAALQLVSQVRGPDATAAFAELLPGLPTECQVALLACLGQRRDTAAASAVAALLEDDAEAVRDAAVSTLGLIGSVEQVPLLVKLAATASGAGQRAARQALLQRLNGDVAGALVGLVTSPMPEIRAEAVRALVKRGDVDAAPALLRLASVSEPSTRIAATEALADLAGPPHVASLVVLLPEADDALRERIKRALTSVCQRAPVNAHAVAAEPILRAVETGDDALRVSLLPLCSHLLVPEVRAALTKCLGSASATERDAAARSICDSRDAALLPTVLALGGGDEAPGTKARALHGAVRLATDQTNQLSASQRLDTLGSTLAMSERKEDKWLVLSALAKLPSPGSLALALSLLDNEDTRSEAAQAVTAIAAGTIAQVPDVTREALEKVLAAEPNDALRSSANELLGRIQESACYITDWRVSGPYRREGLNYAALFDVAFPPETPDTGATDWRVLTPGTDASRPWLMDLLKPLGGHQCVAYVRTRMHIDTEQPVRLEIGSDDGIKVWLNGRLVHANNTARPIKPGSDTCAGVLRQGWNGLMMKVTQNNMGWEYCVRVVKPDGSPVDVKIDADFDGAIVDVAESPVPAPVPVPIPEIEMDDRFVHTVVDPVFRSEGVAVADFNGDGNLDIATGNILYRGPDWRPVLMQREAKAYTPEGYSQEFLCFAEDVNRDERPDLVVVGFPGQKTWWLENPGDTNEPWARRVAIDGTGNESPAWLDVDGDERKELLFMSREGMAVARPGEDVTKPWGIDVLAGAGDPRPGHGLGLGDLNGDSRPDVLCPQGWWEAPVDVSQRPWRFHGANLSSDCAQLCVYDVDGDGYSDVLSSSAHRYGLWWYEQTADGAWQKHDIDNTVSQLHALHLADVNGDGLLDMVTGKRFWAHRQGDPGIDEPSLLCWYELQRADGTARWARHVIDTDSGVGLHFQIADLNGDGRPDIVTSNKKGVHVFVQRTGSEK